MSEGNITLLTDVVLITCVVASGRGEDVVKAARGAGAGGALIHSAHGVGIRERVGVLGIAIEAEKDVVKMLVGSEQAQTVANTISSVAELDRPGGGLLYLTPLESASTYVPREIRNRVKERKS